MEGTNTELLGRGSKFREPSNGKAGRPKVNRELVIRNLLLKDSLGNPRYTAVQIGSLASCSAKTVRRIKNKAIKDGVINPDDFESTAIGIVEADFDKECQRAMGYSFKDWLKTKFKDKSSANYHFNFCAQIWEKIWDKCDLLEFSDTTSHLADQMAIKFVMEFKDDSKRMRRRLKQIRFMIRFLKRGDINDNHLKMDNSKHPRSKRKIAQISQTNFPLIYTQCEDRVREILGNEAVLDLRVKIVTQMRTGNKKEEREFYGVIKGSETKSYLTMVSPDEYQFHVYGKKGEQWDVIWMPKEVAVPWFERYQRKEVGDQMAHTSMYKLRRVWGNVTEEIIGRRLILHDLRKISLTWLYVMGVPLEVATQLNVGWKDLSTAHSHYIDIKKVLRKSYRAAYKENIPDWFKEGLDDFTGFEAVIDRSGSSALGSIQGTTHFGGI